MTYHLFPTSSLFFMLMIFILIHLPTSSCVENEQYVSCGQLFQCGNITNIGYPFRGGDRPDHRGLPEFQLNCRDGAPLLTILSRTYRVLAINNTTETLTVARDDFVNNICPTYLYNATLDPNIFNYTSDTQNLTLYYGCSSSMPPDQGQQPPLSNRSESNLNGTASVNYYELSPVNSGTCNNSVTVHVFQSEAQALADNSKTSIGAALNVSFGLQWSANDSYWDECVQLGGRCGYDLSSTSFTCYCLDQSYPIRCNISNQNGKGSTSLRMKFTIIGISIAVAGYILIFTLIICYHRRVVKELVSRKKKTTNDQNIEAFIRSHGSLAPKQYKYSDVKRITNSFIDKIGQGGYGSVYKGKLSDGLLVAVKLLSETNGNGDEFINEVATISRTSHINVVTLLGFCYERNKRALIYDFMSNGSLDKFIYNANVHLEWKTLYQIAVGIAQGLEYLHRGCNTRIVHFDIKPHNILLDEHFCPKISDFGLAKLCKRNESIVSMLGARGTVGYIAPEVFCRNFGGVSHKSDVYSYGMMVLEMVGVRKKNEVEVVRSSEVYFPDWIFERLVYGADPRLDGVITEEEEEIARKMTLVSLWCIQTNPLDRPSMNKLVEMLEGSLQSLQIPPKPFLSSSTRSAQDSSASLSYNEGEKMDSS